jgi:hypothetical protein
MTRDDLLTYGGITQPITEWALDYGILPETILMRLNRGMTVAKAITKPMRARPGDKLPEPASRPTTLIYDGRTLTYAQWAELTGLKSGTIRHRIACGWTAEAALSQPRQLELSHSSQRLRTTHSNESSIGIKPVKKSKHWNDTDERLKYVSITLIPDASKDHEHRKSNYYKCDEYYCSCPTTSDTVVGITTPIQMIQPSLSQQRDRLSTLGKDCNPGVGHNLPDPLGTGGGSATQERAQIEFSENGVSQ